jgi:hypothetical protein
MSNPITGDFPAVLQVSGATINRLMATLHQNAFTDPGLPSFPHAVKLRIGDGHAIDGVRGLAHCQVGVPRIELIHRATNRFLLEVSVRAWYRPDAGTTPLPAFINGTVRAEYEIDDIDPQCFGWSQIASKYIWVRVVPDTVSFQGTTAEDRDGDGLGGVVINPPIPPAQAIAMIEKQIVGLLVQRFEANPQPIAKGFRRDLMRSLNVPGSGSAVAIPTRLDAGAPAGDTTSIDNVILDGHDVALGLNIDNVTGLAQPFFDRLPDLENITINVHVDLPLKDFDTVYHVHLEGLPTLTWDPHGWYGVMTMLAGGTVHTESIAASATFGVEQNFTVQFDGGRGTLVISASPPIVKARATGYYSGTVAQATSDAVFNAVQGMTGDVLSAIQAQLDDLRNRTTALRDQLKNLDAKAAITFTEASFQHEGVVILGSIALSARHRPHAQDEKLPSLDGYDALESWIPGGRVDSFEWSWAWASPSEPGGKATTSDRFLLRRPSGPTGRWRGAVALHSPLPGLDGWGSVCLQVRGVQVDEDTGELVPVLSRSYCLGFGVILSVGAVKRDRLLVRDVPKLQAEAPFPQLALKRADGAGDAADAANTLVVFTGEAWTDDTAVALREGVGRCGRFDAGLAVVVLFRDGTLEAAGPRPFADVERAIRDYGVPVLVNEDVQGRWSRALEVSGRGAEPAWALVAPDGAVTWRQQGRASGETLTQALDLHLRRSPDVMPGPKPPEPQAGLEIWAGMLRPGAYQIIPSACPPLPVGRGVSSRQAVVTFVQKDDRSTYLHLRELYADYGQGGDSAPTVSVVVDGADAREAEALKNQAGVDFAMVPDPDGDVTDRFGVATWPTTLAVDETGTVSDVETGVRTQAQRAELQQRQQKEQRERSEREGLQARHKEEPPHEIAEVRIDGHGGRAGRGSGAPTRGSH